MAKEPNPFKEFEIIAKRIQKNFSTETKIKRLREKRRKRKRKEVLRKLQAEERKARAQQSLERKQSLRLKKLKIVGAFRKTKRFIQRKKGIY